MDYSTQAQKRSFEATRVYAFMVDSKAEKAFARRAFVAITLLLALTWFVTG